MTRDKEATPTLQFGDSAWREIARLTTHPRADVPVQASGHLVPITDGAAKRRLRVLTQERRGLLHEPRQHVIIRRREQHVIAAGHLQAEVGAVNDPLVAGVLMDPDDRMAAREFFGDMNAVVRGCVVNHDDLPRQHGLPDQRRQAARQIPGVVEIRDDDRDGGRTHGRDDFQLGRSGFNADIAGCLLSRDSANVN